LAGQLILGDQASVPMWHCTGLARAEFVLLAPPRATSRETDSLYLVWRVGLLGFKAVHDAAIQ